MGVREWRSELEEEARNRCKCGEKEKLL